MARKPKAPSLTAPVRETVPSDRSVRQGANVSSAGLDRAKERFTFLCACRLTSVPVDGYVPTDETCLAALTHWRMLLAREGL